MFYTNKIHIFFIICVLLFFCSCQDNQDSELINQDPCESNCVEIKEVSTSFPSNLVATTTKEYSIVAGKKIITKTSTSFSPSLVKHLVDYRYDNLGNLIRYSNSVFNADGSLNGNVTLYYVYENGLLIKQSTYYNTNWESTLDEYIDYEYTPGIEKYTQASHFPSEGANYYNLYEYDERKNVIKISLYSSTNQLGGYTVFLYDENNNVTNKKVFDNSNVLFQETNYYYQGCVLSREEFEERGVVLYTIANTIENNVIVSKEIKDGNGEITREYAYEYECE